MLRLVLLLCLLGGVARAEIIGEPIDRAATEDEMKASLRSIVLVDAAGEKLPLVSLLGSGKRVFVTIWAYWCPNCLAEMAGYRKIAAACPQKTRMIFVSARNADFPKDVAKFDSYGLPWKIRYAEKSIPVETARAFFGVTPEGQVMTPLHYFVTPKGEVEAIVNARMDFESPKKLEAFCRD